MTERMWKSNDLDVPLHDFMDMYHLSENEIRDEGASGRLLFLGVRTPEGGWDKIITTENKIKRWLKSNMPPSLASKVKALGRLAPLRAWRKEYFANIKYDVSDPGTITLPDGTRITDLQLRRSDVEKIVERLRNEKKGQ